MSQKTRPVSEDFEYHFRYFMTALTFGVDMGDAGAKRTTIDWLELNEAKFLSELYEPNPEAEQQLEACIKAADRLIYVRGKPGSGKSSLVHATVAKCRPGRQNVIWLDFFTAANKEDPGSGEPAMLLEWLTKALRHKAIELFKQHLVTRMRLVRFFLEQFDSKVESHVPSTAVAESLHQIALQYELGGAESGETLADWAISRAVRSDTAIRPHVEQMIDKASIHDYLYVLSRLMTELPKVLIVFDNLDAIARPDAALAVRQWVRDNAGSFSEYAILLAVLRSENSYYLSVQAGDPSAVRTVDIDLDEIAPRYELSKVQEEDLSPEEVRMTHRRELERRVIERRLRYLKTWYQNRKASIPDEVQGLFGAFWSCRASDRVRQDADALANWNFRQLTASLGNFARELYLNIDADWRQGTGLLDTPAWKPLRLHIESLYYSWLAGALPERGSPQFSVREYCPTSWHLSSNAPQEGRYLFAKRHHLLLTAVYNAANMSRFRNIGVASSQTVFEWMAELGFSAREVRDAILALTIGRPIDQTKLRALDDKATWNPYGEDRRYLLQAVHRDQLTQFAGQSADDRASVPSQLVLTDRGRQLLEYIGVTFHYVVGLLDQQYNIRDAKDKGWRTCAVAPISEKTFRNVFGRLRRMAAFHVKCIEEVRSHLQPRHGDDWFSVMRQRFCVMNPDRARYPDGGGNLLMDRLLLGTEKYLERLNVAQMAGDPSPIYLVQVRLLRGEFGDYIDNCVVKGSAPRDSHVPAWLKA